jgi:hypothetical protein
MGMWALSESSRLQTMPQYVDTAKHSIAQHRWWRVEGCKDFTSLVIFRHWSTIFRQSFQHTLEESTACTVLQQVLLRYGLFKCQHQRQRRARIRYVSNKVVGLCGELTPAVQNSSPYQFAQATVKFVCSQVLHVHTKPRCYPLCPVNLPYSLLQSMTSKTNWSLAVKHQPKPLSIGSWNATSLVSMITSGVSVPNYNPHSCSCKGHQHRSEQNGITFWLIRVHR